jgi:hypothetical protein
MRPAEIARQLAPKLRPKYLALTAERFVMELPEPVAVTVMGTYPDLAVAESRRTGIPTPIPHITVEIRDTAARRLVCAIEVLSPTNKHGEGRGECLAKRQRLLLSTAHLLEIDLLRSGQHVPMEQPLPPAPYIVLLSRVDSRPLTEVWAVALEQPLPVVPVPLLPGDADAPLDLQLAFTTASDVVGYDLAVDCSSPAEIPLSGSDAAWAAARLREALG